MCIPANDQPYVDQCGLVCGDNQCLDCEGVANGTKVWNLCGMCKETDNINEGMEWLCWCV